MALFLCHLILAAKSGHLCVRITKEELHPSVEQLWQNEEGKLPTADEVQKLTHFIYEGMQKLPSHLLTAILEPFCLLPHTPICRLGDDFYLQRHWIYETQFLKYFKMHLQTPPVWMIDEKKVNLSIDQLYQNKKLLEAQAQAIRQACLNSLTLVTGGPGTGKTYTAGHLIKVFWEHLTEEQKRTCQIALAAPTGKAAANLQRSLSKAVPEDFPPIQAKTLHALLGLKQGVSLDEINRLTVDLLVVDESSMIDVRMMAYLFEALKPGSRIILLGDRYQLASVEAGSVFADLVQLQQSTSDLTIPCTQLTVCLRAELSSLVDFARLVNQGEAEKVLTYLNQTFDLGIKRLHLPKETKEAQRALLAYVLPYFSAKVQRGQKDEQLLELFHTIRLLSPMRKGPFGSEALNQLMWQHISQTAARKGQLAIPIMISTNDYRQELFNGETGVLIRKLPLEASGVDDYALFPSRQAEGQVRRLPALLLPKYEYAYCLSVHKSQGSEFDHVILILPEGSELFGREVFYTAVTRARKQIEIYGSDEVIFKTVKQQGGRLSGIGKRFLCC